jgi:hypothetical protein
VNFTPMVPIQQFAPSADPTTPGTLIDCDNIIPTERGWRSAYGLSDTGMESLTATCVGAVLATLMDGSNVLIAGTTGDLWLRSSNTWSKITGADTYKATSDLRWRFAMMGNNILATNTSNTIQVSASGGTFTTVPSFAPQASLIESVYGFIMAADTNDATYGDQSDRWWCSALFQHDSWTPNVATQCTTGRLVDTPGPIKGLRRLGSNIVAYKDSSMYLGQYVEPPTVWDWQVVSSNVGCSSHDAVVNIGTAHVFLGADNAYMFDGASVVPIGEPIREWFFDSELNRAYDTRIQSCHDPAKSLVYWFYPRSTSTGTLNRALVYNYKLNRWGLATYGVEAAVDYVAAGITYDGIGTYFSTYDAGIDRTYDSPLWVPERIVPAVINTAHVMQTIDGASGTSSATTWHIGDDQAFTLLRRARVRWLTAPTTATMQLSTLNELGGAFCVCGAPVAQNNNKFDKLRSARWHKLQFDMTGDHEFTAVQVDIQPQGAW